MGPGKNKRMEDAITSVGNAASILMERSWAESFFGNISMILDLDIEGTEVIETFPLPVDVPELSGRYILVTRSFSTMEEVPKDPENSLGLYLLEDEGLLLLWGRGPPTSELTSHLMAYSTGRGRAIVHCHMDIVNRVSPSLSNMSPVPAGIGVVERLEPGSVRLAEATRDAFLRNDTLIWKWHGAISMKDSLGECLNRLEYLERYLKSIAP